MNRLSREQVEQWLVAAPPNASVYLVGAGGCGMSGLAHLLLDLDLAVQGSDLRDHAGLRLLRERGAVLHEGHAPEQLRAAQPDLVVYSSAIRMDNPELALAQQLGIPLVRRAVLLAALAHQRRAVCVAGMHGKTTTTALLAYALEQLEAPAGFAVGAGVPQLGRSARMGADASAWFSVEADESDGTLREFHPEQAIVLNIDEEHLDYFANFQAVCDEFVTFAEQTQGRLIFCADDACLLELFGGHARSVSYGFNPAADYRAEVRGSGRFTVECAGEALGEFSLKLWGEKNISNAVAVVAFLHANGFETDAIREALKGFQGADRRQQELFCDERFRIFDDYGHHPAEIEATLRAIREQCAGRLLVAFQPHRYSRTQHLLSEFASCFGEADLLWITEVYAASEEPIADIHGKRLVEAIAATGQPAAFAATLGLLRSKVRQALKPGDVAVFLGAGDITQVAHALAEDLHMTGTTHAQALRELVSTDSEVLENEPLAKRTTLGVGGPAEVLVTPANETDLAATMRYAATHEVPVFLLGRGSNLVIREGGIRGIVICLRHEGFTQIEVRENILHCGAGVRLKHIANAARDAGLAGLEFLEGIPGCLGGALRMNAGAWGGETFEQVESVRFMTRDGQIEERPGFEMGAVYRSCPVLRDHIALSAVLRGELEGLEKVRARMDVFRKQRTESQPHNRSAGCMFKNPEISSAGKLVDECRLKGLRVGGAMVSKRHGNFIVNDGTATANDVLALIEQVRERVKTERGIDLHTEVQVVGEPLPKSE